MILLFPDAATVQLALSSGIVPDDTASKPVKHSRRDEAVLVEPNSTPSRAAVAALKKLGVQATRSHNGTPEQLDHWLQILPLSPVKAFPDAGPQTTVIFETTPEKLGGLIREILRLGNDRQSVLVADWPDLGPRAYLRVVGPPYYTLLRAIDPDLIDENLTAYMEAAPEVWLPARTSHPLAARLRAPADAGLLVRSRADWRALPSREFVDVYRVLDFPVEASPNLWKETPPEGKISVPLRLAPATTGEPADLWVFEGNTGSAVERWIAGADEAATRHLSFAVVDAPEVGRSVILRLRPARGVTPPTLDFPEAAAYRAYWKLPNLYVPRGSRVHPVIRRDTLRKLLADDPQRVVWLRPGTGSTFSPCSTPESAFRPLADWVDYVLDAERETLADWMSRFRFEFDRFRCLDDEAPKSADAPPPVDKISRTPKGADSGGGPARAAKGGGTRFARVESAPAESKDLARLRKERAVLEDRFLAVPGGLDAEERVEAWPDLARINAEIGDVREAAICAANAAWFGTASSELFGELFAFFFPVEQTPEAAALAVSETASSFTDQSRLFLALMAVDRPSAEMLAAAPELAKRMRRSQSAAGYRMAWLTQTKLSAWRGDPLALARTRDEILYRLYESGLNREHDLPGFLRFSGNDAGRLRQLVEKARLLSDYALKWVQTGDAAEEPTRAYARMMFAVALGRLGEANTAREMAKHAEAELNTPRRHDNDKSGATSNPVHAWLASAFAHRVELAVSGRSRMVPFPEQLEDELKLMPAMTRYGVDRMRVESRTLEPVESFEVYRETTAKAATDTVLITLGQLALVSKSAELAVRMSDLLTQVEGRVGKDETVVAVLKELLLLSMRAGEVTAQRTLDMALPLLERGPLDPFAEAGRIKLIRAALMVAAQFDIRKALDRLIAACKTVVGRYDGKTLHDLIADVATQATRTLVRLQPATDAAKSLVDAAHKRLFAKGTVKDLPTDSPDRMRAAAELAQGWLIVREPTQALPILDALRSAILDKKNPVRSLHPIKPFVDLVRSYLEACQQLPIEDGLARIEQCLKGLPTLPNTTTTARLYSRMHLAVVEQLVQTLTSENFSQGAESRRWMDDDEFLTRRRIHIDTREALAGNV